MKAQQSKSILFKLASVIIVLSGLLIVSSVVSWLVFDRVAYFQTVLSTETIPNAKVARQLTDISGQLVKISVGLDTPRSANVIEREQIQVQVLGDRLQQFSVDPKIVSNQALVDIKASIKQFYGNVGQQLEIQRNIVEQSKLFDEKSQQANAKVNKALAMLKVVYAKQAVSGIGDAIDSASARSHYVKITELRHQVQSLKNTLSELSASIYTGQTIAIERRYRNYLRKVSLLMLDLPEPVVLAVIGSVEGVEGVYSESVNVFQLAKKISAMSSQLGDLYRSNVDLSVLIDQKKSALNEQSNVRLDNDFTNIVDAITVAKVTLVVMVLLSLLTALLVYFLFIKPRIIARIERLTRNTLLIADGDYRSVVVDEVGDEISIMTQALDSFRKALIEKQSFEKALVDKERRLSTIINESIQGLFTVDEELTIVSANPSCLLMLNAEYADIVGQSVLTFFPDPQAFFDIKPEYGAIAEGDGLLVCKEEDLVAIDAKGVFFTACLSISLIHVSEGRFFSCFVDDVTEQRQSGKKIDKLVADLKESNADLESFAYSCSHDLQEPVRIVVNFSQLLTQHMQGFDDEKAKKYLGFIWEAATNSQQLIRDILDYSRLSKAGDHREPVVMAEMFDKVDSMVGADKIDGAALTFSGGDVVLQVAASSLQQLLLNLIGNGFKFNRSEKPVVLVAVVEHVDHWLISVKDNGIGIDPAYHQQIFQLFKRLTTRTEFPGSGIGLAKCQRIVQKNGGRIWVDSVEGQGSSFFVSLPKSVAVEPFH